jgi:hypothetical protein
MKRRRSILIDTLHFSNQQVALGEKCPDVELIDCCALAEDATREVDGGEGKNGEKRASDVDSPTLGLHFDDAADDQVADFWCIACAEGYDGEEFVCFEDCAED